MTTAWHSATVEALHPAGPSQLSLVLGAPPAVLGAYHRPGQYHRLQLEGVGESLFALASPPGAPRLEYLVKVTSPLTQALSRLGPGATVQVSLPEGPGFPLARAEGRPLLLVGTGTGFAPLRATLEALRPQRARFGPVTAVWGTHGPTELHWHQSFPLWAQAGIDFRPTVTTPSAGWQGRVGRVHAHLSGLEARELLVFACGQRAMVEELKTQLAMRGVGPDAVLQNFG
jgi:CDP-4-dehydro-6-deoxyglucose reductase